MPETQIAPKCSKCSKDLDTEGTPKWCKACRAEYRREYDALRVEKSDRAGWHKGVAAAREYFATQFAKNPGAMLKAYECANWIRSAPGPKLD